MKNNKKQYDRPKTKERVPMVTTIYEKKFESLEEMVEILKDLHPEFSKIFKFEDVNPCTLIDGAVDYLTEYTPDVLSRTNLPVSLNVTANKVSLKTSKYFSVEWTFKYDREGNISDITATVGTFTRDRNPEELDVMIEVLNNNWSVREFNK